MLGFELDYSPPQANAVSQVKYYFSIFRALS